MGLLSRREFAEDHRSDQDPRRGACQRARYGGADHAGTGLGPAQALAGLRRLTAQWNVFPTNVFPTSNEALSQSANNFVRPDSAGQVLDGQSDRSELSVDRNALNAGVVSRLRSTARRRVPDVWPPIPMMPVLIDIRSHS